MPPSSPAQLEARLAATSTDRERLACLLELAERIFAGNPARGLNVASEAWMLAERLGDAVSACAAQCWRGVSLLLAGEPQTALGVLEAELERAAVLGTTRWLGEAQHGLGLVYDNLGLYDEALKRLYEAYRAFDEAGVVERRLAASYRIGVIFSQVGKTEEALTHQRQLIEECRALGMDGYLTRPLVCIGITLRKLGRHAEAFEVFDEALAHDAREPMPGMAESTRYNRARVMHDLGRVKEAEAELRAVLPTVSAAGMAELELLIRLDLVRLCIADGRYGEAEADLAWALTQAERGQLKPLMADTCRAYAELYQVQGRYELAYRYLLRFHDIDKDVFNERSEHKFRSLQIGFEVEKTRRETELLRERHAELTEANEELRRVGELLFKTDREKSRLLAELERLSVTDALTGLYNRRHLDNALAQELERSHRYGHTLSLAMCDVDHFKQVNDRFSHQTGDAVLRTIALLMREQLRDSDIAARFGGEEFALILVETDLAGAHEVCEKLRQSIEHYDWQSVHAGLSVTISIGLAEFHRGESIDTLIGRADHALYEAKHRGRNRICMD